MTHRGPFPPLPCWDSVVLYPLPGVTAAPRIAAGDSEGLAGSRGFPRRGQITAGRRVPGRDSDGFAGVASPITPSLCWAGLGCAPATALSWCCRGRAVPCHVPTTLHPRWAQGIVPTSVQMNGDHGHHGHHPAGTQGTGHHPHCPSCHPAPGIGDAQASLRSPRVPSAPDPTPVWKGRLHTLLTAPCPLPTDNAETQAATMPDSPADVKTQSRSTPPSMPPPPPAVTQGVTRHPTFTPNTSEYRDAGGDGMQGGCPAPFASGSDAAPGTGSILRLLRGAGHTVGWHWLSLRWRRAFSCVPRAPGRARARGEHHGAAHRQHSPARFLGVEMSPCPVSRSPNGGTEQRVAPGAVACRGLGGGCCGLGECPHGSELAPLGVPDMWGPACLSACGTRRWQGSVTAACGGKDVLALPRSRRGGIRGLGGDSRSESSVSVAQLNWGSPRHWLHRWHVGLLRAGRSCTGNQSLCQRPRPGTRPDRAHLGQGPGGQGPRLVPPSSNSDGHRDRLLQLLRDVFWSHACTGGLLVAASRLETPVGKKTPPKPSLLPQTAAPPTATAHHQRPRRPPGRMLSNGCALRGFAF